MNTESENNLTNSTVDVFLDPEKDRDDRVHLFLHQEELSISKKRTQTSEVTFHTELLTEEKTIVIPVTREDLVIRKKVFNPGASDQADGHTEVMRIPISEESIEVSKHPKILADIDIYKRQFQEMKQLDETIRQEKLHIETIGNPTVIDDDLN